MKSTVFSTSKRGGITDKNETELPSILRWRHPLASYPMLAKIVRRLGDTRRPWLTWVVISSHEDYMCLNKIIASLSVLSSDLFYYIIS